MPDAAVMALVERRLLELGCPRRWMRDKVSELADHHDDLRRAALEDGLSERDAMARADARLGDPVALAERAAELLRESSWWGRHRLIGFCLLPLLLFGPVWLCCAGLAAGICRVLSWFYGPAYDLAARVMSSDPGAILEIGTPVNDALTFSALLLSGMVFCWLIRRSAAGPKWMWIACGIASLNGLFMRMGVQPRSIFVGYTLVSPDWSLATVPLLVAAGAFLHRRELVRRLPPIPKERRASPRREKASLVSSLRLACRTPTYWLIAILAGLALALTAEDLARDEELNSKIWPAERAATRERLKERQAVAPAPGATTVALGPWLNAGLLDTTDGRPDAMDNNLAELPEGIRVFGGIPFDVGGKLQLAGEPPSKTQRNFPGRVDGIRIGRKCARIHLLHGASRLWSSGRKVARIVLHYADGSRAEFGIIGGEHVLDWWGPIYDTDAGDGSHPASPGTELAWTGSNPWIEKRAPDNSLRLYRTTFVNPRPELEVTSLDYISTLGGAAPFMVGLTTEQPPLMKIVP